MNVVMGMEDWGFGCEIGVKRGENDQIWPDMLVQKDGPPEVPLMGESA